MEWLTCPRAYIYLDGRAFDKNARIMENLDPATLIQEIGRVNPNGDGVQLYDDVRDFVYEGKTKAFLVRRTQRLIQGMPEAFSENENMAQFVSLRQLKRLLRSFAESKKAISGYGILFFYTMYILLKGQSPMAEQCEAYLTALYDIVRGYLDTEPDDELAYFFLSCYVLVMQAIREGNTRLSREDFPPRPRKHPNGFED